jgi:hypothetical protein
MKEAAETIENRTVPAYRDFSQINAETILRIVDPPKAKRKGPRGGVQNPFPVRLFDMLDACEKEGMDDIVAWQPHGRSFIVRQPKIFQSKILPQYVLAEDHPSFISFLLQEKKKRILTTISL